MLYSVVTIHHDFLLEGLEDEQEGATRRVAQLSASAERHLKLKLTALYAGVVFSHADFAD